MNRPSEHSEGFDPEVLHVLGEAMDEVWRRLNAGVQLNGNAEAARAVLAEHLFAMARQGERDHQRPIEGALIRLTL